MRYLKYVFLVLSFGLFGALIGAPSANAASEYDDAIQTTDNLNFTREVDVGGCLATDNIDISYDWSEGMEVDAHYDNSAYFEYVTQDISYRWNSEYSSEYKNAWENKTSWGVVKNTWNTYGATIYYTDQPDVQLDFITSGDAPYLDANVSVYRVEVERGNVTHDGRTCGIVYNQDNKYTLINTNPANWSVYFLNFTINYPSGYEGIEPSGSAPLPAEQVDYVPDLYVSTAVDFEVSIHDTNFNTFDQSPFLCDGLAPVLHYEIWDVTDNVMLDYIYNSATVQIDYQLPEKEALNEYMVIGWYDCGEGWDFTETSSYYFEINSSGSLHIDMFEECLSETFPFVHPNNCLENVYSVINVMYYGTSFADHEYMITQMGWEYDPSCRELAVLDEWLGLPNSTVCPQFDANMRGIITPFIGIMLGLITVAGIIKLRGGE